MQGHEQNLKTQDRRMFSFSVERKGLFGTAQTKPFVKHIANSKILSMLGKCVHNGYL